MEDEIIRLLCIKGLPRCVAKQIVYLYEIDKLNKEIDKVNTRIDEFAKLYVYYSRINPPITISIEAILHCLKYRDIGRNYSIDEVNQRQAGDIIIHEVNQRAKLESLLEVKKKLYLLD